MPQGHQGAAGYLATGRIMPGDKQVGDHVDGFGTRQALTVSLGGAQCRDEIAARVFRARCRQRVDVGLQLGDRLSRVRNLLGCHDEEHGAQGVRPLPEYLDVGIRYTEQAADQPCCECRKRRHEITAVPHGSDGGGRHVGGRRPQRLDGSRRERPRDKQPHATVIVALCREHQRAVPVAEGSIGDAHHVEEGQPDSGQSLIVGQRLEVRLAEHDGGTGHLVRRQWSLTGGIA